MKKSTLFIIVVVAMLGFSGMADAQNTVRVEPYAAMNGTGYGLVLDAVSGQTNNAYVQDNTPDQESTYRASFWIDPNAIGIDSWSRFAAFSVRDSSNVEVIRFQLQRAFHATQYRIRLGCLNNAGVWKWALEDGTGQKALPIGDTPTFVTIEMVFLDGNQGYCHMEAAGRDHWNGGYQAGTYDVHTVRLGGAKGISGDMSGEVYFDEFESYRTLAP